MQLYQDQQAENDNIRTQLEQLSNDKVTFVREKIDDLVHKEVQLKLNNIKAQGGFEAQLQEQLD